MLVCEEPDYLGPHLSDNFNEADFEKLLHSFRNQETLHTRYVLMILNRAIEYLHKLENINEIDCIHSLSHRNEKEIASGGQTVDFRVNVVGDLHGQFIDLFTIFDLNNLPSASNQYLFNGVCTFIYIYNSSWI